MPRTTRPPAALSLDLDNQWAYMMTHGDAGWEALPSYLDILVPRVLGLLDEFGLRITFFVVGQDAALEKNRAALRAIAGAGHEIANHSFHHRQWLHRYSAAQIEEEIATAEAQIERATGQRPAGFRGPGFSLSRETLEVLVRRSYVYDATTFPTFLGPLARAYYFLGTRMSREERRKRDVLFGGAAEVLRPIQPYRWLLAGGTLVEIPTTTMPLLRLPFHLSYLLYLASYSPALALQYFRTALALCRATSTPPSFLLHPLDFLGCDDGVGLEFFPAMRLPGRVKCDLARRVLELLCRSYQPTGLLRFAEELKGIGLPMRAPSFARATPASGSPEVAR
jgi:peptidoglycan-N-acetylglucosamine deacetylase